ncbi:hypothetical protein KJ705_05200 [Patescibacteria group bacterium]|nr:hypothetical protein [Patescibacteria group bacterium]
MRVAIQQWVDEENYSFEPKISDDRLSWSLVLKVSKQPPTDDWGFMLSEVIHHLRSVLDNIVVMIAQSTKQLTSKEMRSLQFPITVSNEDWQMKKSWVAILPEKYQKAIENIQPFQRIQEGKTADQDPLLLLRELNNSDKHHIQIKPIIQQMEINHGFTVEFHSEEDAAKNVPPNIHVYMPAFVDNALLLKQETVSKIAKLNGKANFKMQLQVEWKSGQFTEMDFCIGGLCYYTGVVLEYLTAVK